MYQLMWYLRKKPQVFFKDSSLFSEYNRDLAKRCDQTYKDYKHWVVWVPNSIASVRRKDV